MNKLGKLESKVRHNYVMHTGWDAVRVAWLVNWLLDWLIDWLIDRLMIEGVLNPRTNEEISFDDAIALGIINQKQGTYVNSRTRESMPIQMAMNAGKIKAIILLNYGLWPTYIGLGLYTWSCFHHWNLSHQLTIISGQRNVAVPWSGWLLFANKFLHLCSGLICTGNTSNTNTIHKLLQSSSPRYLCDLITVQPSRSTRSSTLVALLQPSVHSSSYSSCSLSVWCFIVTQLFSIVRLWSGTGCWHFSWRFSPSS